MGSDRAEPHVESLPRTRAQQWVTSPRRFAAPSTATYELVWDLTEDASKVCYDDRNGASQGGIFKSGLNRGPLRSGCGPRSMRLVPPLDITEREITLGAELLIEVIGDATANDGSNTDSTAVI